MYVFIIEIYFYDTSIFYLYNYMSIKKILCYKVIVTNKIVWKQKIQTPFVYYCLLEIHYLKKHNRSKN